MRFPILFRNRKLISILLLVTLVILAAVSGLFYPSNYSPLFFLGLVVAIVIAIAWLIRPIWALYAVILVMLLPAGSIPDIIASLLNRSMIIIAIGVWAISIIASRRRITWTSSSVIMLAFVLWSMITILWAKNTSVALTYFQLYALRFLLFLFLIPNEIRTKKDADGLFFTLAVSGWIFIAFSIAGLIQTGYTPGTRFKVLSVNENDTGLLLMITLLGVLWWSSKLVPGNRLIKKIGAGIFLLLAIGLTSISGSRGSAISLVIMMAVFGLWRSSRPWAIFGLCALLIGMIAFPSIYLTTMERFMSATSDTLGGRDVIWEAAWRMIFDHPLRGVGIGNASYDILPYLETLNVDRVSLHNPILVIWSETGLPGLLLYLGTMVSALASFAQQYFRHRKLNTNRELSFYFAIVSSVFVGFMASWFKGGSMEIAHSYFLMLSLLLIPASMELDTFGKTSKDMIKPQIVSDELDSHAE